MSLTIVVADGTVHKDEINHIGLDLSTCSIPANVWALQWDGTKGHIEYQGQGPNEEIDKLPNWATAAEAKWQTIQDAIDTSEKAKENATTETFWADYPTANWQSIDKILLKTYEGVTNVRGADPESNVVKAVETTDVASGSIALSSLATLLNDCKALGVPVTSNAFNYENQNFKDYMTGLGYSIYSGVDSEGQTYEKLYYPWSDDLAAKKADQDVNIAREASLAAGVDWNGSNWQIDLNSRNNVMNQLTAITSGVYTDATVTWRNTANVDVDLTVDEFKELAGAVNTKVEEIYLASFASKA